MSPWLGVLRETSLEYLKSDADAGERQHAPLKSTKQVEKQAIEPRVQRFVMLRSVNTTTLVMNFAPIVATPKNLADRISGAALNTHLGECNVVRQIFETQQARRYF